MSGLSTHVLDTARGMPAAGLAIALDLVGESVPWAAETDVDGRVKALLPPGVPLTRGVYMLRFDTGRYFHVLGVRSFYPTVHVIFEVTDPTRHHHVPLLISPFGYSTYRGS